MNLLVSACLLGIGCKYSGGDNLCPALVSALQSGGHTAVPVCPEVYGGLPTPRPPAERRGSRVVTEAGADVTAQYRKGAETALALYRLCGCQAAVLKANSPSCGCGCIYDGNFTHTRVPGDGVTAQLLKANGVPVFTEENFTDLHGLAAPASPASENEAGQSPAPEFVLSNPLPPDAARIRQEVFVQEQGFAEEFDSIDRTAWHLVLYRGGQPAAVCRFFPGEEPGSYTVGRLAVRRPFRKMGLGAQVLAEAERRIAALGGKKVVLAAQVRAGGFYLRQGYAPRGEEFLEEYCPHIQMEKTLAE